VHPVGSYSFVLFCFPGFTTFLVVFFTAQ